jgi:hypothetical protein
MSKGRLLLFDVLEDSINKVIFYLNLLVFLYLKNVLKIKNTNAYITTLKNLQPNFYNRRYATDLDGDTNEK